MQTLHLLCPGPGLDRFPGTSGGGTSGGEVTIAVNRAISAWPCDYWAFVDWQIWPRIWGQGNCRGFGSLPILATKRESLASLHRHYTVPGHIQAVLFEEMALRPPWSQWSLYSATCALVLAVNLDADRVIAWGCPMRGTDGYDGPESEAIARGRSEERWKTEREIWDRVRNWAGFEIVRMTDDGTPAGPDGA